METSQSRMNSALDEPHQCEGSAVLLKPGSSVLSSEYTVTWQEVVRVRLQGLQEKTRGGLNGGHVSCQLCCACQPHLNLSSSFSSSSFFFFSFFLFSWDSLSLFILDHPGTHSVDQAVFELRDLPTSASQMLGLKVCTITIWLLAPALDCVLSHKLQKNGYGWQ